MENGRRRSPWRLLLVPAAAYVGWRVVRSQPPERKQAASELVNRLFEAGERHGLIEPNPGFRTDHLRDYPELAALERNHDAIKEECLALLEAKSRLTDVQALAGTYTEGGIHTISWKSFMFKSGKFIEENCALAPRTAELLRGIPGVYTAFFSILDPQQYVRPHWGYYKGFLRYHLGVVVPNNNEGHECFLRVNDDPRDNAARDKSLIERGEKYYWREGEGVLFDDTFLHDAANESDEVRVVLWLDVARRMSRPLDLLNRLVLWIAYHDPSVKEVRRNAVVTLPPPVPVAAA
jgi:aspartyl/asparaginyl beta-hydroxylase (cupin superfamily)